MASPRGKNRSPGPKADNLGPAKPSQQEPAPKRPSRGPSGPISVKTLGAGSRVSVSGTNLRRAQAIAEMQRGRVARRQLLAAGMRQGAITRMIKQGLLVPIHHGVYTFGLDTPVELGDETAALLACREGAVLSHYSAPVVWDVWPADRANADEVHVTAPSTRSCRQPGICAHRSDRLTSRDVRVHRGLPVTSPARTWLDLAPELSDRDLERLFDEFLIKRLIRPQHLVELRSRCGGHPGRGALRRFIDVYTDSGFTRSEAERLFRELIREARLPEPQTNVCLHGYEVDAYWPEHRLAVEIDGYVYHRSHSAFERDPRKSATLQAEGIAVMRFTWNQLRNDRLATIAMVARGLGVGP